MGIAAQTRVRLEFAEVCQLLARRTDSAAGELLARELLPLELSGEIRDALAEVVEAQALLDSAAPPLAQNSPLRQILERAAAAGSLLPAEQLQIVSATLNAAGDCRHWAEPLEPGSRLAQLCAALDPVSGFARRLRDAIGSRAELLDSASCALGDIRRELRQLRGRIKQQLEQLLAGEAGNCFQEQPVTLRNGRYVVPLKADFRSQVKGLVHDESASGQTLYLEPELVLAGNNRLHQLLAEEKREERRILLQLTDLVRENGEALARNEELLSRLDLRFAAARLAEETGALVPELVDVPMIALRQARHPLLMRAEDDVLDVERAVPTDLLLTADTATLVISGPNTGGKSVALKSFGLLLLMLRAGLPIPCAEGSRIYLFDRLYVDIGDQQSISEQLSTFSGHLQRLHQILQQSGGETLVLLDEAGTGTDPAEGAALVIAALEMLQSAGAKIIVTTHLGRLKSWAAETDWAQNAAVDIDPQTLQPRYRLSYGIPGASSAMATAQRLGLPEELLDRAQSLLGEQPQEGEALLLSLTRRQQELEALQRDVEQQQAAARRLWKMRREQLQKLQQEKKAIRAGAIRQAETLIAETTRRLRDLRRKGEGSRGAKGQVEQAAQVEKIRRRLDPFRAQSTQQRTSREAVEVGELVRILPLGVSAEVMGVQGHEAELQVAGKRMRQALQQLESFEPKRFVSRSRRPESLVSRPAAPAAQSQRLVLVGQRVEPALQQLERFIDDALLAGLSRVDVVHGSGTGRLRQAVREFFAEQSGIIAFYAAPAEQGGERITIAELRD